MPELLPQPALDESLVSTENVERLQANSILESIEARGIVFDNRNDLAQSLDMLRQEFAIKDEAFLDFKKSIIITAAANRMIHMPNDRHEIIKEMEFVADVVMAVTGQFTEYSGEYRDSDQCDVISQNQIKKVYEKYTQPELSKEMTAFVKGPALDRLRQRLGIKDEEPFEVHVLSIDAGNSFGLMPTVELPNNISEDEFNERIREIDYRRRYEAELKNRTNKFAEELAREDVFAPAWVYTFDDGTKYLCFDSPLAEKLLYANERRAEYYSDDSRERDFAILEHEYVHTQNMLTDGCMGLGIALEELRAEHFSGNKQGYADIKWFFKGIKMLTGYDVEASFEKDGKAYDQNEFLADIAKNIGLDGLLDAVTAMPSKYVEDKMASKFVKSMAEYNGSLSDHFKKIFGRLVEQKGRDNIDKNVSKFVDGLCNKVLENNFPITEATFFCGGLDSVSEIAIDNFKRRYAKEEI